MAAFAPCALWTMETHIALEEICALRVLLYFLLWSNVIVNQQHLFVLAVRRQRRWRRHNARKSIVSAELRLGDTPNTVVGDRFYTSFTLVLTQHMLRSTSQVDIICGPRTHSEHNLINYDTLYTWNNAADDVFQYCISAKTGGWVCGRFLTCFTK